MICHSTNFLGASQENWGSCRTLQHCKLPTHFFIKPCLSFYALHNSSCWIYLCLNFNRILNNNNLNGTIPDQLTNCFSLASLWVLFLESVSYSFLYFPKHFLMLIHLCFRNFSYNNLSGVVPPMRNFSRFLPDRYARKHAKLLFSIFASADSRCLLQLYWKPVVVRQLVGIDM